MRCTLIEYVHILSAGTIAGIIGKTKYAEIDTAKQKVIAHIYDRGIQDSCDWTRESVWALFKEVV